MDHNEQLPTRMSERRGVGLAQHKALGLHRFLNNLGRDLGSIASSAHCFLGIALNTPVRRARILLRQLYAAVPQHLAAKEGAYDIEQHERNIEQYESKEQHLDHNQARGPCGNIVKLFPTHELLGTFVDTNLFNLNLLSWLISLQLVCPYMQTSTHVLKAAQLCLLTFIHKCGVQLSPTHFVISLNNKDACSNFTPIGWLRHIAGR